MTTQPQPEALRLAEAMKQRVIPRWVHATGETPRQSGFTADAECQAAAAELLRLHAECEDLRKELHQITSYADALNERCVADAPDAERYRWLRGEHQRVDPLCHVVWKRNGDRHGSEWVNTAELDTAIDAARAAKEQT